ncbi:transposase [Photobacterium damselae subsp. damselae]|uniref:integrase catalytic domain-containing protein n=1 Tax=Photobacterium damselae TaxID=38293 RepID=UPI000D058DED|nr:Mu transposase C-terminal domain-containing protein [Photobacterium damselae]PSB76690.1 transposase [Photobacterium damselae subsp. damselae]
MVGRFHDESEYNEDSELKHEFLPEIQAERLKYSRLQSTQIIERDLSSYPEEQKNKALERYKLLCLVANELSGGWTSQNLTPLIEKHFEKIHLTQKPSYKSLQRWHNLFSDSGGSFTSLVDKNHRKGNRKARVVGDEKYYDEALRMFLDARRQSIRAAYTFYCDRITIANETIVTGRIPKVSYQSFKNRIRKEEPYSVALARHGKYYADKLFNYYQAVEMPTRILERVEMDHTPLDLILLHDELMVPLGRAHLTLLVDVFSGCIIGFHLGFKAPSYVSASRAVIHAIKSKTYISEMSIEFNNEWLCDGKIENLVIDNGAEFWSQSWEDACREVGINVAFNKVRKPWLKPFVERKFGEIIQGIVGWVPGKTFSNVLEKEDYKPEKDAVMRFSTFVEEFHRWIVDVHNANADSRCKRIPNFYWKQSYDVLPPLKLLPEREQVFKVVMGIFHYRKLTGKGIKFMHLDYDCVALSDYRKTYPQTNESSKKKIKVDPDDLSSIYVYLEELQGYVKVPSKDTIGYTVRLSVCEHEKILAAHRTYIKGEMDTLSLAKARLALHDRIESEQADLMQLTHSERKRKAKSTKKVAEISNVNSDTPHSKLSDRTPKPSLSISESESNSATTPLESFKSKWNERKNKRE